MSGHKANQSPVVRFLGLDAGRGGPFALLGLPHLIGNDQVIDHAVQRRLRQIECHPHRGTPDADEVRLAIHSAASQLRDPDLREHLAMRWPEGTPIDMPKAWAAKRATQKLTPALMRRARMIVGSSGGWNTTARRRLAHLARINRLGALEIISVLGGQRGTPASQSGRAASNAMPQLPQAPSGGGGWTGAYAILALLGCSLIVTVLLRPDRQIPATDVPTQALAGTNAAESFLDHATPGTVERDRLSHYTAIAHELDRLVARASTEPEAAMERFSTVYPQFVDEWTDFPLEALQRAAINIAEFIVRLEAGGISSEQLTPLLAIAGTAPDRELVGVGVLDVTLASPQLSTETRAALRSLRERLSSSVTTPRAEIRPSIIATALHLARTQEGDDPEWWESWLEAVIHATQGEQHEREALLIEAISARLRDAADPNSQWQRVASMLVRELGWQRGSNERYWLLAQFGDDQVSTVRLAMLTEALVSSSAADGVDARMVLARDANITQRQQLEEAYEASWFAPTPATDSTKMQGGGDILNQLRIAVTRFDTRIDDQEAMYEILALTASSTAAVLHLHGNMQYSQELLQNPPTLGADEAEDIGSSLQRDADDRAWAEQAANCDSAAELRPYLDTLRSQGAIGINSAHALVHLVVREPELELRELAIAQLTRYSDQISVLLAIDHALTDQRVSSRLDHLVRTVLNTTLPNRNDPAWFGAARRELLTRMGGSLGRTQQSQLNQLQHEIAALIALRLQSLGFDADPDHQGPALLMGTLNQTRRMEMQSLGGSSGRGERTLGDIDAQAIVMRARAQSAIQRYLAELEYEMGLRRFEIDAKFPGTSTQLESIMAGYTSRMSSAGTVLQQIAHTQHAIAQLLIIELERGGSL